MGSIRFGKWRGRLCASVMVGLSLLVSVPAMAGPFGAVGDLYVVSSEFLPDVGDYKYRLKQFDSTTGAYVGDFVALNGWAQIMGMAWAPNGNLFLMTGGNLNGRWFVREYDGQTGASLGKRYQGTFDTFSTGKGLTFGPNGDLYVGDWAKGEILRIDGSSYELTASYSGIGTPNAMSFTDDGTLRVISGGSSGVFDFDVSGGGITPLGQFASYPGSIQPQDMDVDAAGNLYLSGGMAGGVGKFDSTGTFLGSIVPPDSNNPTNGVAMTDDGRLLVSIVYAPNGNGNRVLSYDSATGAYLGEFIATGTGGMDDPTIMSIRPVPEPASFALLLVGGLLVATKRRG